MADDPTLEPGWYVRPDMHKTLCFWDGDGWTERYAPVVATLSTLVIARGVAIGSVAAVAVARLLFGLG